MNKNGSKIEDIAIALDYDRLSLDYNYRLPKSIAKVAQLIQSSNVDFMSNNRKDGGNSDYPNYPKPIIAKFGSRQEELQGILNRIQMEDLDDVAILVPTEADVMEVNKFLNDNGVQTQVHYRTSNVVPFRTINTLDFPTMIFLAYWHIMQQKVRSLTMFLFLLQTLPTRKTAIHSMLHVRDLPEILLSLIQVNVHLTWMM